MGTSKDSEIIMLVRDIFEAGSFIAETFNERLLCSLMAARGTPIYIPSRSSIPGPAEGDVADYMPDEWFTSHTDGPYRVSEDGKGVERCPPEPATSRLDNHLTRIKSLEEDIREIKAKLKAIPSCTCNVLTGGGLPEMKPLVNNNPVEPIIKSPVDLFEFPSVMSKIAADFIFGKSPVHLDIDMASGQDITSEHTVETAWVIEKKGKGLGLSTGEGRLIWVPFTDEALIRFSRKEDGTRIVVALDNVMDVDGALVCDHQWIGEPREAE